MTRGSLPAPQVVPAASATAVADFWGRLASFVAQGAAPKGWDVVSPASPFIGVLANDTLVLNRA